MKFALYSLAALASFASAFDTDMCCSTCSGPGIVKIYSTPNAQACGESCIPESKWYLYKIFEWGMKLAENGNNSFPCKEHGYTEYTKTETHRVPGIVSVAVDFWYVPKN